jgi:hypothetical protein
MITSTYTRLFGLAAYHTYFEKYICTCLEFTPDASTTLMLERYGFKIRKSVNGFDLFFNGSGSAAGMLEHVAGVTGQNYFAFTIDSTNEAFLLFTDLSVDWLGQLEFDSSSPANQQVNGTIVLAEKLTSCALVSDPGVLRIYFADILANTAPAYEIRLNARATQWQYYIVNKSAAVLDNPAISGKPAAGFSGPESVTIPTGQQAMLFSSGDLLPLSEVPKYKFDLVNHSSSESSSQLKSASGGKIIFKGLPNPDPGRVGIVQINGKKQTASPIYVYL